MQRTVMPTLFNPPLQYVHTVISQSTLKTETNQLMFYKVN